MHPKEEEFSSSWNPQAVLETVRGVAGWTCLQAVVRQWLCKGCDQRFRSGNINNLYGRKGDRRESSCNFHTWNRQSHSQWWNWPLDIAHAGLTGLGKVARRDGGGCGLPETCLHQCGTWSCLYACAAPPQLPCPSCGGPWLSCDLHSWLPQ